MSSQAEQLQASMSFFRLDGASRPRNGKVVARKPPPQGNAQPSDGDARPDSSDETKRLTPVKLSTSLDLAPREELEETHFAKY